MRICAYCGQPNAPGEIHCTGCGTALPADSPSATAHAPAFGHSPVLDLGRMPGAFRDVDGFSRAEWERIMAAVDGLEAAEHRAAWHDVAVQWADRLRRDLGGRYAVLYSRDTVLLSDLPEATAGVMVRCADAAAERINQQLGDLAWRDQPGPRVVLFLSEADDYYGYIGTYHPGETLPESLGVHLMDDYPHMVIFMRKEAEAAETLIHELAHNCVRHLPLPHWLNEGVAMTLEKSIAASLAPLAEGTTFWEVLTNWQAPLMWDELAESHHAHWNEHNIQEFWAGTSFHGEAQSLSYSLAEVLVRLLGENREPFLDFLACAQQTDAGQTAALDCLGLCLGDAVGTFLGPGRWRPVRAAMVKCWEAPPGPAPATAEDLPTSGRNPSPAQFHPLPRFR